MSRSCLIERWRGNCKFPFNARIQLAGKAAYFVEERPDSATAEQIVFGHHLRRALESGEINYLALCKRCARLFFRKSLKGELCGREVHNA